VYMTFLGLHIYIREEGISFCTVRYMLCYLTITPSLMLYWILL